MFTADFGFRQLRKWMKRPDMKLAVFTREVKLVTNLIVSESNVTSISRVTGKIVLSNNTVIQIFLIDDKAIQQTCNRLRGGRWHFIWGHQTPSLMKDYARCGMDISDYPVALFTE